MLINRHTHSSQTGTRGLMSSSVSKRKLAVKRSSIRRNVTLSEKEAEGLICETPGRGGGAESLVERAANEDTGRVQSCCYGLRSGTRRKTSKRTTAECKSSLIRKRARKAKDDVTETRVQADEVVRCLEGEFLEKSEGTCIVAGRAVIVCTATRIRGSV